MGRPSSCQRSFCRLPGVRPRRSAASCVVSNLGVIQGLFEMSYPHERSGGDTSQAKEPRFLDCGYRLCSRPLACSAYQRWKVKTMSVACAASLANCSQVTGI